MCCVIRIYLVLVVAAGLVSPTIAGPNLVINGDFESGLDNWIWTGDGVDNVATISTDTPSGTGSSADLDINEVLGLPWLIQDVPVTAGDMMTFSASVREVRQFHPDFDAWIAAQVWMLPNSESGQILDYNFTTYTSPSWETKNFEITVPAGATIARVLFTPQDPDFGVGTGQYRVDNVSLSVNTPTGLLGDYNADGAVDAADYVVWRKNDGTSNPLPNDNGLGTPVGAAHYALWQGSFGASGGGGGFGSVIVPEPTTLLLASAVAAAVLLKHRRRRTALGAA
jgi:hypothetical protein